MSPCLERVALPPSNSVHFPLSPDFYLRERQTLHSSALEYTSTGPADTSSPSESQTPVFQQSLDSLENGNPRLLHLPASARNFHGWEISKSVELFGANLLLAMDASTRFREERLELLGPQAARQARRLLGRERNELFLGKGYHWILRNLTRKEFVSNKFFPAAPPLDPLQKERNESCLGEEWKDSRVQFLGLTKALCFMVTTIARLLREAPDESLAGSWACDSFDVVREDASAVDADDWEGVSEAVKQAMLLRFPVVEIPFSANAAGGEAA